MKISKHILIVIAMLASFSLTAQVVIDKSKDEMVRIDGKLFYSHLVVQGETVYSLCRAYSVSSEELVANNPQLTQGLKIGQRLKIPHKTQNEIVPDTKIVEPQKTEPAPTTQSAITGSMRKHKIKKRDSLESIAEKFDCSVEDLLRYNSHIKSDNDLKKGQYITIPDKSAASKFVKKTDYTNDNTELQDTMPEVDTARKFIDIYKHVNCGEYLYSGEMLNVALMLPIKAANINYLSNKKDNDYRFIEFYEGFLFALDSLSKAGISVNINTFDVYDKNSVNEALNSDELQNANLIIGPVYYNLMDTVAKFAAANTIPVVSPLDIQTTTIANSNPFFVQAPTPNEYQTELQANSLCAEKENIVIIYRYAADSTQCKTIEQTLAKCGKKAKTYQYILLKSHNETLATLLDKTTKNNVWVLSNDEVFVKDVLSKLNTLSQGQKFDISVYGSSQWKTVFKDLKLEHFYNLNSVITQRYYIDYSREDIKDFIRKYRYYYKGDPSNFSFAGYDTGLYFISKLAKYGRYFPFCIDKENDVETLLQTKFKFVKAKPEGGLVNTASFLLRHQPDMEIVVE